MTTERGHGEKRHSQTDDWNDNEFVEGWIARLADRAEERRRQYVTVRALIPKQAEPPFRYINLGAGDGGLDEVLLDHFEAASVTLVDVSSAMLEAARKKLARFGSRVTYVQANLAETDWTGTVGGPFDVAISALAFHVLRDTERIRGLYNETYGLLSPGGMLLNLDYMCPPNPVLADLALWAAKDAEASLSQRGAGSHSPGTLLEHLGWLSEAGFEPVDVLWKNMNVAILCGVREGLHLPEDHGRLR